jgi:hypothetical protein
MIPETLMLPPFLGQLLLLGTAAFLVMAFVVAVVAGAAGRPLLARRVLQAGGGMFLVYAAFWVIGVAAAPTRILEPGQAVSFCGLDCHLHVSVRAVHTAPYTGVVVRFASNAARAPEYPAELRVVLRQRDGTELSPTNAIPDSALAAGAHWDYELRFPEPVRPEGAVLIVTWKNGIDLLVPGAGNPLVQRRQRLALPAAGVAAR